jgi:hypothetical protein
MPEIDYEPHDEKTKREKQIVNEKEFKDIVRERAEKIAKINEKDRTQYCWYAALFHLNLDDGTVKEGHPRFNEVKAEAQKIHDENLKQWQDNDWLQAESELSSLYEIHDQMAA